MKYNPFKIVSYFEETVAEYCGSQYAVSTDSCTSAIFLCCKFLQIHSATIPSKTYISPALSIMHAGANVILDTSANDWKGIYQIKPHPIYDAAKRFTSGMYIKNSFMCLSFHIKKHLKLGKGGMILTDDLDARDWFRKASYEGRSRDKSIYDDNITMVGWNMYMAPHTAAMGLSLMQSWPDAVADLPNSYRDLRTFKIFENCKIL